MTANNTVLEKDLSIEKDKTTKLNDELEEIKGKISKISELEKELRMERKKKDELEDRVAELAMQIDSLRGAMIDQEV